jgi:hypothetical protein
MARLVLTDAFVTFATVDISQYITSITLSSSLDVVETTGMSSTSRTRVAGLRDNQVTFEFNQDFASSALESIVNGVTTTIGTAVTMVVKPVSGATTATNPSYTFSALVSEWQSLSGSIGDLATVSVTWPISGAITKATS